jgi:hypothetical protein
LHDLNGDGVLEESELIRLNETVAQLHQGDRADSEAVEVKYRALFRSKFDPEGRPVPLSTFRAYIVELLSELDSQEDAQEMILEQFIAEAGLARHVRCLPGPPCVSSQGVHRDSHCSCYCLQQEKAEEFRTDDRSLNSAGLPRRWGYSNGDEVSRADNVNRSAAGVPTSPLLPPKIRV